MIKRELTGQKFGRLTVKEKLGSRNQKTVWLCACECGQATEVVTNKLTSGHTKSCGCYRNEFGVVHGMINHSACNTWKSMMARCYNENHMYYSYYGGKGITVCDEWHDFDTFCKDMGERPEGCSLDRIDGGLGYSLSNCRWATAKEQANNRSNNTIIEAFGKSLTLSQWADELDCSNEVVSQRIRNGWSVEDAVSRPVGKNKALTFKGMTKNLSQWAKETGIAYTTIVSRYNRGLAADDILKGANA